MKVKTRVGAAGLLSFLGLTALAAEPVRAKPELPAYLRVSKKIEDHPLRAIYLQVDRPVELPVVEEGPAPRVLATGCWFELAPRVSAQRLETVTRTEVVLVPNGADLGKTAANTVGVHLPPGALLPYAKQKGEVVGARYEEEEFDASGYLPRVAVGLSFRAKAPRQGTACALQIAPAELLSAPEGKPLITCKKCKEMCARALGPDTKGFTLVRAEADTTSLVGWIPTSLIQRKPGESPRSEIGITSSEPCVPHVFMAPMVELANQTALWDAPEGEIIGVVSRDWSFLVVQQRGRWAELEVRSHQLGLFNVWAQVP
jgi:hypothetical protein